MPLGGFRFAIFSLLLRVVSFCLFFLPFRVGWLADLVYFPSSRVHCGWPCMPNHLAVYAMHISANLGLAVCDHRESWSLHMIRHQHGHRVCFGRRRAEVSV